MERISSKERLTATEIRLKGLLVSACAGDDPSYLLFLQESAACLRGYFRKRLPSFLEDVEDLVQETLLAVHNCRYSYDGRGPLTGWLYAIARYKMADWYRGRATAEDFTIPFEDESVIVCESDTEAIDAKIDIHEMLVALPDRLRIPIMYVKLQGLSIADTAKLTGMSESAVKIGIHRGLRMLGQRVRDQS
jgi:RNA polymerase sigma-70 factor (ECF subfamily)